MSTHYPPTLRRLRQSEHIRALTREIHVQLDQLIQPCFVAEGAGGPQAVPGLAGVMQVTVADLLLRGLLERHRPAKWLGLLPLRMRLRQRPDRGADRVQDLQRAA